MTNEEYLSKVLADQRFEDSDQDLKDLRERRRSIETLLRGKFAGTPISIRWGGSMAKGTMIRESFDGDMTCYFNADDTTVGDTLEDIYNRVAKELESEYLLDRKTSALRVRDKSPETRGTDFHIDVVAGRYTDEQKTDVFIHQNGGTKERLKTNLQVHIDHIKDSGVVDAICLLKLWNVRNGIGAKTFILELLAVKLLKSKKGRELEDQLTYAWTQLRDDPDGLAVEDPANPGGNDLKPALDSCRYALSSVARSTLSAIESKGWESTFGALKDKAKPESNAAKAAAIRVAVQAAPVPTRPWCRLA